MNSLLAGVVIMVIIAILSISIGVRSYILKKLNEGKTFAFLKPTTQDKILKHWKSINIVVIVLFVLGISWGIYDSYNNVPEPPALKQKVEHIKEVQKTLPPVKEVKEVSKLDQETFFYCLDKASTKKDGLSADVISACKDASLHIVVRQTHTVDEKTDRYI